MRDVERRAVPAQIELREAGGKRTLFGYAALYDSLSDDLGGFLEVIRPGAFDRALAEKQEVLARSEHDTRLLLGRTSSGTLRLSSDSRGLRYEVDLPDTQAGRDMATLVSRGDVKGSSFAFMIPDAENGQRWLVPDGGGLPLRELLDLDLFDVAPTANPAYPETTVSARALEAARALRADQGIIQDAVETLRAEMQKRDAEEIERFRLALDMEG